MAQVYQYCNSTDDHYETLTSENTKGPVNTLLKDSRLGSKEECLDKMTFIENYERKFKRTEIVKDVEDEII